MRHIAIRVQGHSGFSCVCCLQLCAMHELDGHRFCRYHELGQYVFGPRLGLWVILPPQLVVMIGLGIVYAITGGGAMHRSARHALFPAACSAKTAYF